MSASKGKAKCPHPEKRRYDSKAEAKAVIRDMYKVGRGNPDLGAYQCVCGAWHIGNSYKHFQQRIKTSLIPRTSTKTIYGRRRRRSRR